MNDLGIRDKFNLIEVDGNYVLDKESEEYIYNLKTLAKVVKDAEDIANKAILKEFEEKGIKSSKSDLLDITYIASSDRETFDKKKFQEDNPDLYDAYVEFKPVKSSLRITVK